MEDFAAFQAFSVLVAVLSCCCMLYTGFYSQSRYDHKGCDPNGVCVTNQASPVSFALLRTLMWQILTIKDFQIFVVMNFFQVFVLAFLSNFTMIFTEHLIPGDVLPPLAKSVTYGAGFICPQVPSASALKQLAFKAFFVLLSWLFLSPPAVGTELSESPPRHRLLQDHPLHLLPGSWTGRCHASPRSSALLRSGLFSHLYHVCGPATSKICSGSSDVKEPTLNISYHA